MTLSASLAPVLRPTLARVRRLFDLQADPVTIAAHLGPLAEAAPGLRVPGAFDGFEVAVRAILGQQVSVRAASTLAGRLAAALGEPIMTPLAVLTHLSPTPERVAAAGPEELVALGILAARARSIVSLARAVAAGEVSLEPGGDVEAIMARLRSVPGIGEWTAQYVALRALAWPDAFPHTDLGHQEGAGRGDAWADVGIGGGVAALAGLCGDALCGGRWRGKPRSGSVGRAIKVGAPLAATSFRPLP